MEDAALSRLSKSVIGLDFVSEKDAPFESFGWEFEGNLTPKAIRELGGHGAKDKVKEVPFDEFFEPLTKDEDWFEAEEKARAVKCRELLKVLREELTELKVYSVGKIEVTYYILGHSKAGNWIGVKTESVET